jgi:predicted XRE-type DNA-binding protein
MKPMSDRLNYTVGSGNVFADLELPHAEERLAKAKLAYRICALIGERGWGEADAADELGIDRPEVPALLDGRLAAFSLERLIHFLNALDQDVEIVVRPNPSRDRPAGVIVAAD